MISINSKIGEATLSENGNKERIDIWDGNVLGDFCVARTKQRVWQNTTKRKV